MHQALEIYDIIRLILDHLARKDHCRIALVCKSLLEPALDVIWSNLDYGPSPLFRLWPEDAIFNPNLPPHSRPPFERHEILVSRLFRGRHLPVEPLLH